jgi:hypothetical protein
MKKYKIIFPENSKVELKNKETELKIKSFLKNNTNQVYARIMVFLYNYDACSVNELSELMSEYFKIPFDKSNISRYVSTLSSMGLISSHTSLYAMTHNSEQLLKVIRDKHEEWLKKIPSQFHKKFSSVNYYYVTTYGEKFLSWCCEIIEFKCKEEKNDK